MAQHLSAAAADGVQMVRPACLAMMAGQANGWW